MGKSVMKIANRYGEVALMANVDDKDNLVLIRAIANNRTLSPEQKVNLIRGYCQCIYTVKDVKDIIENTAV